MKSKFNKRRESMKKLARIVGIGACALMVATTAFAGNGRGGGPRDGSGHRYGYQQMNQNQNRNTSTNTRRNFVDNDGINDNQGTGQGKRYGGNGPSDDTRVRPLDGSGPRQYRNGTNSTTDTSTQ
jgi:hypothetical protein